MQESVFKNIKNDRACVECCVTSYKEVEILAHVFRIIPKLYWDLHGIFGIYFPLYFFIICTCISNWNKYLRTKFVAVQNCNSVLQRPLWVWNNKSLCCNFSSRSNLFYFRLLLVVYSFLQKIRAKLECIFAYGNLG